MVYGVNFAPGVCVCARVRVLYVCLVHVYLCVYTCIGVLMCVCVISVCAPMCMPKHICVEASGLQWISCYFSYHFFETVFVMDPDWIDWLASEVPGPSSASQC